MDTPAANQPTNRPTGPTWPTQPTLRPSLKPSQTNPGLLPDIWQGLDLTRHPDLRRAVQAVIEWYNQESGALILMGGCGVGKTHIAKAVLKVSGGPFSVLKWLENGGVETVKNAVFYAEADLLADIRKSYNGHSASEASIIRGCQRTRLLILDDIGVGYIKEESQRWYEDIMWRIFDTRASGNMATMITTNLSPVELKARLGVRAYSRLQQMMGRRDQIVNLFGVADYRAKDW